MPLAEPVLRQAVIYARVSSKEQEKEGFSILAQLRLLKEYAAAQGFKVARLAGSEQPHSAGPLHARSGSNSEGWPSP